MMDETFQAWLSEVLEGKAALLTGMAIGFILSGIVALLWPRGKSQT
jgi:hypothetical protein